MAASSSPEMHALGDKIAEEIQQTIALMTLAIEGLRRLARELEQVFATQGDQDERLFVSDVDPVLEGPTHGSIPRSELIARSRVGGPAEVLLIQQWIVSMFARWEGEYRPAIARLHGVEPDQVKSELFGDLRWLRNDVVHNNGVVKASAKCAVLGSFKPGDTITLGTEHFRRAMTTLSVRIDPPSPRQKGSCGSPT